LSELVSNAPATYLSDLVRKRPPFEGCPTGKNVKEGVPFLTSSWYISHLQKNKEERKCST